MERSELIRIEAGRRGGWGHREIRCAEGWQIDNTLIGSGYGAWEFAGALGSGLVVGDRQENSVVACNIGVYAIFLHYPSWQRI